jgi:hypothetical protein
MLLSNRKLFRSLASSLVAGILVALTTPSALAVTALKKVQVGDGQQLFLMFDSKISQGQIKTEFFNDTVQLSLNDVSVYPAKIFSVGGPDLTKVFAYQYAPKLVRCRLTLKGDAESYKERVSVHVDGKMLTVRIGGGAASQDSLSLSAAQSVREKSAPKKAEAQASWGSPVAVEPKLNADEKLLLDKVLRDPEKAEKAEKGEKNEKSEKSEKFERTRRADKSDRSEKNGSSSLGGRREAVPGVEDPPHRLARSRHGSRAVPPRATRAVGQFFSRHVGRRGPGAAGRKMGACPGWFALHGPAARAQRVSRRAGLPVGIRLGAL